MESQINIMLVLFKINNMKHNINLFLVTLFTFCAFLITGNAEAATLSLLPSSSTISSGDIITINVVVNSEGVSINNSNATIQFPTDLLQVVSVSKGGSIFSLWVEEPSFSNISGEVSFNGGITNPGYTGSNGQLISVTFRAKKAGTASILFSDSSVLANDGLGTNVLNAKRSATLSIKSEVITPVEIPPVVAPTPSETSPVGLNITSTTHPDQNAWYNLNNASLKWKLPTGVKTVETSIDSNPNGLTKVSYTPAISSKEISNIDDGISYFHLRYLTKAGWSKIFNYRLQIDKSAPHDLTMDTSVNQYGQVIVHMNATDDESGILQYKIQMDKEEPIIVLPDANTNKATYTLPAIPGTNHTITFEAYDRAQNKSELTKMVNSSIPPVINIISYPNTIKVNQKITITGQTSYKNSSILVSLTVDGNNVKKSKVVSDEGGVFHFESDQTTDSGIYILWADLLNQNEDVIASSGKVSINVKKPVLIQIGSYTTELLSVLIPAVALLLALLYIIYYAWHKLFGLQRRLKNDLEQAQTKIHQAFKALSEEANDQIAIIEKSSGGKKMTKANQKAIDDLRTAINQVDEYTQKLFKKIEDTDL